MELDVATVWSLPVPQGPGALDQPQAPGARTGNPVELPAPADRRPLRGGKTSTVSRVATAWPVELAAREGVVVNRDESSHARSECSSGQGDPGRDVVECASVTAEVWPFLDG